MSDLLLPRTLIVLQVIFGRPLRGKKEFRSGEIENLVGEDIGLGNYAKVLDRLVVLGWVNRTERRERGTTPRNGRPSIYVYNRTRAGREGYVALKSKLAKYGINLS
jgi:hypothetical protein